MNEAEIRRLPGARDLLRAPPDQAGIATLRTPRPQTRSDLEADFLAFLNDRRFPRPQTNTLIEGIEVDCVWPDRKLIVELDSYTFHGTRQAFEEDRSKDRRPRRPPAGPSSASPPEISTTPTGWSASSAP